MENQLQDALKEDCSETTVKKEMGEKPTDIELMDTDLLEVPEWIPV